MINLITPDIINNNDWQILHKQLIANGMSDVEIQDIKNDFDKTMNDLSKITVLIETLWDELRAKPDNITINILQ